MGERCLRESLGVGEATHYIPSSCWSCIERSEADPRTEKGQYYTEDDKLEGLPTEHRFTAEILPSHSLIFKEEEIARLADGEERRVSCAHVVVQCVAKIN